MGRSFGGFCSVFGHVFRGGFESLLTTKMLPKRSQNRSKIHQNCLPKCMLIFEAKHDANLINLKRPGTLKTCISHHRGCNNHELNDRQIHPKSGQNPFRRRLEARMVPKRLRRLPKSSPRPFSGSIFAQFWCTWAILKGQFGMNLQGQSSVSGRLIY